MLIPVMKMKTETIKGLLKKENLHPDNKKVLLEELNFRLNNKFANITIEEFANVWKNKRITRKEKK
jgi:hypothetical protein